MFSRCADKEESAMGRITRRHFLKYSAAGTALVAIPHALRSRDVLAEMPAFNSGRLRKYVQPLPVPGNWIVVATPSGSNAYTFTQCEISRQLHPDLPPTPF